MSDIIKGHYKIHITESTGQFSITGNSYTDANIFTGIEGGSIYIAKNARDLIDLLNIYLKLMKKNKS